MYAYSDQPTVNRWLFLCAVLFFIHNVDEGFLKAAVMDNVKRYRFYKGRPVKVMRLVPGGIRLIFVSRVAGTPGDQLLIQQKDWDRHGDWRTVESSSMEHIRTLVPAG